MSTALDIIKGSLRKMGVIAQGEVPSAQESQDALRALNMMLDTWSNKGLTVTGITIDEHPLTVGKNTYTMGPGGDFNVTTPVKTEHAFVKLNDGTDLPLTIIYGKDWGDIRSKSITSIPDSLFINRNFPLHTVHIYPTPNLAYTLILHNLSQFSELASLTTEINLPKGYERAIEFNLCKELAPEYGKQLSNDIYQLASESLADIKRMNIENKEVSVDPFLLDNERYDWRNGQ